MINIINFTRLILTFMIGAIALYAPATWQLLNVPLVLLVILPDSLDSITETVFNTTTKRIIEVTLWIILAELGMVSVWVAIILITKNILIDALRAEQHPAKTTIGKFLLTNKTVNSLVELLKLSTFTWLFFLLPTPDIWPDLLINNYIIFGFISDVLIYTTVMISLARGLILLRHL